MDSLIPWLAFGIPLLLTAAVLSWFFVTFWLKPDREMKKLEERAAAGDPSAQAALARADELKRAMTRAAGGGDDPERQRVLAHGRPARAVIVDVKGGGMEVSSGSMPVRLVEVTLSIDAEPGPYTVTVRDAISQLHLGRLLKGATVPVRIDPLNPQHVVVLWDTQ